MNLPMVIEAYASRFSMEKAQEIAAHLVNAGKDGVRVKPESLEPKKKLVLLTQRRLNRQGRSHQVQF